MWQTLAYGGARDPDSRHARYHGERSMGLERVCQLAAWDPNRGTPGLSVLTM
jgi:hypothetical protein